MSKEEITNEQASKITWNNYARMSKGKNWGKLRRLLLIKLIAWQVKMKYKIKYLD